MQTTYNFNIQYGIADTSIGGVEVITSAGVQRYPITSKSYVPSDGERVAVKVEGNEYELAPAGEYSVQL